MYAAQEDLMPRGRDALQERREQVRYQILKGVYERGWTARDRPVPALDIGLTMGLSREELFRTVLDLTHRSFLKFCGAGPQVCITDEGVSYIEAGARRRRSVRDS